MILVPVRIDRSRIHGFGVFTDAPIPAGSPVWRFTPGFDLDLDPAALDAQPEHFRKVMLHYGYIDLRLNRFILCCDDYRFMNHSDAPNVRVKPGPDRYGIDVAARDIAAGEELTVNYQWIEGRRPPADA
ncbi:MAG: SET domain-containing protein [Steroidobacteraceae bacterium]|nr:SET domain-containing protein [Steroidobacteraceae bacterium]